MAHLRTTVLLSLLLPLALVGCNDSDDSAGSGGGGVNTPQNLLGTLQSRGLTTLATAIQAAGLGSALEAAGPLTLFAPTNAAFAALPAGELQRLLDPANVAELRGVLQYHLVAGLFNAATLENLTSLATTEGRDLSIDAPGGVLFVNDARVVAADVQATNGLLHELDSVLVPPTSLIATLDARGFTILSDLIDRAGLTGALTGGNVTLVAPTDEAFLALPAGQLDFLRDPANQAALVDVLTFHALPGRLGALQLLLNGDTPNLGGDLLFACVHGNQFRMNGVACPRFNVPASDGVLHIASEVLTRTTTLRTTLADLGLTTLVGLIDLAGLDVPLSQPGTFSLFAPSEAAFAAMDPAVLAQLQDPANTAQRLDFLNRHLLLDALQEIEVARYEELTMQNGQVLAVDITAGVSLGGVTLATSDRLATNGIVHIIEAVLPGP